MIFPEIQIQKKKTNLNIVFMRDETTTWHFLKRCYTTADGLYILKITQCEIYLYIPAFSFNFLLKIVHMKKIIDRCQVDL